MKKVILLAAAILTMSVAANAQFSYGVKAGLNVAGTKVSDTKSFTGFNAGVLGQFKFPGSGLAVQPEVLFSLQGSNDKTGGGKTTLGYINIPVMLQYYIIPGLDVEAGPQVGFLALAKYKDSFGAKGSIINSSNGVDFGINVGAAFQLPTLPLGFFARYTIGVTDIAKDVPSGVDAGQNRVFSIGAFWKF